MSITAIRGTRDLLPDELVVWRKIEETARAVFERFAYREIRTPLFEATELFVRGVGDTTDIVEKEMYTFLDKGERSVTLRPEGTASVVRACLEHNLFAENPVQKFYYIGPMYRYERPQAGRYREFWQAGIESFGVSDATMDAEVLLCAHEFLSSLGIKPLTIHLNSIGAEERPAYLDVLREFLRPHLDQFGDRDRDRFERNTLRLFDTKDPSVRGLLNAVPKMLDHLSPSSAERLNTVRRCLDRAGVHYTIDPDLVRGLDYYTHTVFEIKTDGLGSQDTVLAGGRYDHLVEHLGGKSTPGIGFGAGIDRLALAMESQKAKREAPPVVQAFVAVIGKGLLEKAFEVTTALRRAGVSAEMEYQERSLRAQMKTADKLKAPFVVMLGEDEIAQQAATVRNMSDGSQESLSLADLPVRLAERTN